MAPVEVRSAPEPTREQVLALRASQTRVLSLPFDRVFPKVIDVLLDSGYVVLFADKDLGVVSFHQQWNDASQHTANITQEGTAVFRSSGGDSTEVRLFLTGGWQRLEPAGGVGDTAMISGVQQSVSDREYARVLNIIEQGLLRASR